MINNVEQLSMCLFIFHISSLMKCQSHHLFVLKNWSVAKLLPVLQIHIFTRYMFCKYFCPVSGLSFILLTMFFKEKVFNLMKQIYPFFFFCDLCFSCSKKSFPNPRLQRLSQMFYSRRYVVLAFGFRTTRHFNFYFSKLTFVYV